MQSVTYLHVDRTGARLATGDRVVAIAAIAVAGLVCVALAPA